MSRAVMQQALDALEIAVDLATEQCNELRASLGSRCPGKHAAADRDAEKIEGAAKALRAALAQQDEPVDWLSTLGFVIEQRSGVHVVVEDDESCRPANLTERVLWNALMDSASIAAPAAPVAQQDEPVAYVCPTGHAMQDGSMEDGPDYLEWADEASDYEKRTGTPLYAAPQPAPVAQPLTDEQIEVIIGDSDGRWNDGEFRIDGAGLVELINAVERANGIGSKE